MGDARSERAQYGQSVSDEDVEEIVIFQLVRAVHVKQFEQFVVSATFGELSAQVILLELL